jgi:hypothetical protein
MRDAKIQPLFGGPVNNQMMGREFVGLMLLGEAKREAPAQAELRPTRSFALTGASPTAPGELIH